MWTIRGPPLGEQSDDGQPRKRRLRERITAPLGFHSNIALDTRKRNSCLTVMNAERVRPVLKSTNSSDPSCPVILRRFP